MPSGLLGLSPPPSSGSGLSDQGGEQRTSFSLPSGDGRHAGESRGAGGEAGRRQASSEATERSGAREKDSKKPRQRGLAPASFATTAESGRGLDEHEGDGRSVDWVPSDEVTHCNHCLGLFSVTKWKHHCRACGKVFCGECSMMRIRLPDLGYFEKVRVCVNCALARSSSHTISLQEDLDVKEQINANFKLALEEKTRQLDGFRAFLLEVEGLLLSGAPAEAGLCFSTGGGRAHDAEASGPGHAAEGGPEGSQDELSLLMRQSERGLRALTERLQQYDSDFEDARLQLLALENERDEQANRARQLEARMHAAQMEIRQLKEVALDRDALRALVEEQKRQLEEQKRQLDGLRQRCVTLESKSAASNATASTARASGCGDSKPSSLTSSGRVEPYTWGSGSDRNRCLGGASLRRGDSSAAARGLWSGEPPEGVSRRPVVVGRTDDFEELAVAFTVADGLNDSNDRYHGSRLQRLWAYCRRCCCRRRRRRYFIGDERSSLCVIQ
ncbi:FYVE zinc finger domain-containing protein [Besnoitia besnoiti]|uniref:FYVE zinc finger domain-containing protein n=1 Tax=Besnoitia besnoiti TaxID=94643 RepID=A0A2A9M8Q1_BESBE|nr:FYVE zinc finger domain-containing protein [Besnoitia besnoiti]PFH32286.1 FYVE zinc finger domain-containing protein [Besnoitia besnoiti]